MEYTAGYKISRKILDLSGLKYPATGYPLKPNIRPDFELGFRSDAVYKKSGYPIGHISRKSWMLNLISGWILDILSNIRPGMRYLMKYPALDIR